MRQPVYLPSAEIQSRLLRLAAIFLFLVGLTLTLSPAVRERSWQAALRWNHWIGLALWTFFVFLAHRRQARLLPDADPYIFPIAALLSGWGMLTVWRLTEEFGLRQALWISISLGIFFWGLKLPQTLDLLRRYKYVWLTSGLLLTALTLVLGANPGGAGPHLWLGCCGVYLQPSEPLKLLLVVYLAAYFANRLPLSPRMWPLLLPTLFLTGLSLTILLIQRDLGTASIFVFIYASTLYHALAKKRILLASLVLLLIFGLAGYTLIDVIQLRVDAWINPWNDPAGHAYQVIQSLLAVANGGIFGRGIGLGSPGVVPVAHSDFIFTAIAEETGLVGVVGLLALLTLLVFRGYQIALRAEDPFQRLLAAGLTAYLGAQSLLIIGGNLRLLPLTGVTLPLLSYGGSSLLTTFTALLLLLHISQASENDPAPLEKPTPYLFLPTLFGLGFLAAALATGWWGIVRSGDLLARSDNPRRAISDRFVPRGSLLDRHNTPIAATFGTSGNYSRQILYPALSSIVGYTHPIYGQAGLEFSLDDYLRGLAGYPASRIWWEHLLYGQPPPGLDVRLSLDLHLQTIADTLLGETRGAIALVNAKNGEILVVTSHPTFNANLLDEMSAQLFQDQDSPLLNRAEQGYYAPGTALAPFWLANRLETTSRNADELLSQMGFSAKTPTVTPLQMALAAAALSNAGVSPSAHMALAVNTPDQGWLILPFQNTDKSIFSASAANDAAQRLMATDKPYWEAIGQGGESSNRVTWYLAGTLPNWQGTPLALVLVLEADAQPLAQEIGQKIMNAVLIP
ncbi:MAG: hypothetical protein CO094_11580 [Anaerolineae bacterium CG_4_9_14_3_um_filter_57_17]|nr:FtsW/RodA/SpoVE family cell cycle protein [bacterium]NCT20559.1 FtsW/RodA/SpoVE family cell cycle protein [bacterium]OIO86324.1 MAG: hypothetical protein AUK01_03505 [Anaerolineae bacterium CG2_30_57_67]PJB64858.1 MAG: hypothetical protein CO094_11580 [Anaerolineae bacterium CG_4_9_14_3_um_filter_57_17]